jgi:hypothetical protein
MLQSFNNDRNSRVAFYSRGLSVLDAFEDPIHVTARLWNNTFHKNANESFALSIGLPDSLRYKRLEGIRRYRHSFHWRLDSPMARACCRTLKIGNGYFTWSLSLLAYASFWWLVHVSTMKKLDPAIQNLHQRESIKNFEFTFQSVNDDGQSRVAIFPLRFSELDPSNSPVRFVAWFGSATLDKNAYERFATGIRSFNSSRDCDL